MLMFKNVKIIHTEVEDGKYNEDKGKYIKHKRPKTIIKTVFDDDYVGDVGELYEAIKFHVEKCHSGTLEVKLKPDLQY